MNLVSNSTQGASGVNVPQGTQSLPHQATEPGNTLSPFKTHLLPTAWSTTLEAHVWPTTIAGSKALFDQGEPAQWLATLPKRLQKVNPWNLLHEYQIYVANLSIAHNLKNKIVEIELAYDALRDELEARGLTLDDLQAFDAIQRSQPPFGYGRREWMIPPDFRTVEAEDLEADNSQ